MKALLRQPRALFFMLAGLMTLVASIPRFLGPLLSQTRILVFDEMYYVPQALALLHPKVGVTFPDRALTILPESIADFSRVGDKGDLASMLGILMHPPLGKWLMALGMLPFSPEEPLGWRLTSAVLSTLLVPLIMAVAWLLFRSPLWATLAGAFVALDGQSIALGRLGMLESSMVFLVTLGLFFTVAALKVRSSRLQSVFIMAVGLTAGAAVGVKWMAALWFLLFAGALFYKLRRGWLMGVASLIAFVAYALPWYLTDFGPFFGGGGDVLTKTHQLIAYHGAVAATIVDQGLQDSVPMVGVQLPYPLSWVLQLPWLQTFIACAVTTCTPSYIFGNPALWLLGASAFGASLVQLLRRRASSLEKLLVACIGLWLLPWFFVGSYLYYSLPLLPFLSLLLVLWLRHLSRRWLTGGVLGGVLFAFVIFLPQWTF